MSGREREIDELNRKVWNEMLSRPEESLRTAESALAMAEADGYAQGRADALLNIGWCEQYLTRSGPALQSFQKALDAYTGLEDKLGVIKALNALGSGILLLGPSLLWGRLTLDKHELVILLILALVQFTFPYFLFSWALQRIGAHKASLLLLLEVVLNPVWTFFAVGERPSHATLIGGPLILLGVASAILIGSRKAAQG